MAGLETHFTEPTTHYWQVTMPTPSTPPTVPYRYCYPALLPNKHTLNLPIRQLKNNPREAVASLLVNQASLDVVDELGGLLTEEILRHGPDVDVVVGLPTLGLSLSNVVARGLGHCKSSQAPSPTSGRHLRSKHVTCQWAIPKSSGTHLLCRQMYRR